MKFSLAILAFLIIPLVALAQGVPPPNAMNSTAAAPVPTPTVDAASAPKITCAAPNFDFKTVDEGPDIVHEFHCRNHGMGKLIITNVSTSCGCTAAVVKKQGAAAGSNDTATYPVTVMPGRGFVVKATFHTSGRPGHSTKFITVTNNDPTAPGFQLKLDMTVVRDVDLQPDRLYLYGLKHGEAHSATIKVLGKPGMPLNVLSAQSANGVVTVASITPYKDDNKDETQIRSGATIEVDLSAAQTIGSFTDSIVIKTDSEKKPEVTVPVLGEVTGNVQFNPKSLYFAPQQSSPVTISFTVEKPQGFAIRRVESAKHLVRPYVFKTSDSAGDHYYLVVSVNKNIPKESDGKDEVMVYTNDADQSVISIDVQANK
ncbi:MAG TPA: DUF1573 domain-containing protein [bacterium]|jgi:hypothetical protein|nr:DUF1573 domain-containing protein [bacterium]